MVDGEYTLFGHRPLPAQSQEAKPAPMRRVLFFWGAIVLGVSLAGMAISGLFHRRARSKRPA